MQWFETLVLLVIITVVVVEGKRGFGRGLFDLVGAIVAVKVSRHLAYVVAPTVHLLASPRANEALLLAIFFGLLGTLFVLVAHYLYRITLLSLDVFDHLLGLLLGMASGVAVAHVLLIVVLLGSSPARDYSIRHARLYRECVNFETYHSVINFLEHAR